MQKEGKPNKAAKAQTLLSLILENDNMSEESIIAYLKANVKNAKKEIKAALKHIEDCAYEMTMNNDYEEYELEYEDETGIPAYECDDNDFQRWFEDKLLDEDLAKIRTLLEELMNEKIYS